MGMLSDMFCSSPASTATRKTHHHHHQTTYNITTTTPRLIRVLSSPCHSTNDVALNPSRHEYKQLLQTQNSNSSCYGADVGMEQLRRRRSSADVSDVKEGSKFDWLVTKMSDSGRSKISRRSSVSYDENPQLKSDDRSRLPPIKTKSLAVSPKLKSSSSSSRYHGSSDKVVVLWVSLHCKGCEAKVRKHISKMEGVKSFSTDWMSKRVTIISNMDPHDVLASVSTVKYAHFWPASSSSSSSSSYYNSPSPLSSSSSATLLTLTR